jgi:hypothetical protein
VIDCARLYKVIRPDLVASTLIGHLICPQFTILGVLPRTMKVIDLSGQDPEGLPTVRMLVPPIDEDMEAGWDMPHTNCGIRLVLMLAALSVPALCLDINFRLRKDDFRFLHNR